MENQLKTWNDTAEKVLADMQDLIAAMDRNVLVEKHDAVVKERNEAIANLLPQDIADRPVMTDDEIRKLENEINEVRNRMQAVKKPSEWPPPPAEGLQARLQLNEGELCLARSDDGSNLVVAQVVAKNIRRDITLTGLRVAALVESSYYFKQPTWSTGTIGTLPNTAHNKEFLIFFDDGFEEYVQAAFDSCDDD
ncbi:unnamed protein product, partial [Strongylus vulgaris]